MVVEPSEESFLKVVLLVDIHVGDENVIVYMDELEKEHGDHEGDVENGYHQIQRVHAVLKQQPDFKTIVVFLRVFGELMVVFNSFERPGSLVVRENFDPEGDGGP